MSETQLVKSILEYLNLKYKGKILLWRNNSGATTTAAGGFVRYGEPGSSDLLGYLAPNGRLVCIECKSPKGKATPLQKEWLLKAGNMGALVGIVRTVQEAEEMITSGLSRWEELL